MIILVSSARNACGRARYISQPARFDQGKPLKSPIGSSTGSRFKSACYDFVFKLACCHASVKPIDCLLFLDNWLLFLDGNRQRTLARRNRVDQG